MVALVPHDRDPSSGNQAHRHLLTHQTLDHHRNPSSEELVAILDGIVSDGAVCCVVRSDHASRVGRKADGPIPTVTLVLSG